MATNFYAFNIALLAPETPDEPTGFNCACDDDNGDDENRGQLRRRMLVRLGYAAQADNPPPGMADLVHDFLVSAQRKLFQKHPALRLVRFFTWTMEPGVRFYDLPENDERVDEECTKIIDALNVKWVGISDTNESWIPIYAGIRPEYYTSVQRLGIPSRYEIRQCIEVFPAPDRAYKLRVKAGFKQEAFTTDAARTSIPSELVFLRALADAKYHYGHPDADRVDNAATDLLKDMKAGLHLTKRYVPQTEPEVNLSAPIFLPLQDP